MTDTRYWEIDRLAARRLLGRLKIDATTAKIDEVASAFAEHRQEVQQWTASRVQSRIITALEVRSMEDFVHMDAKWANGFIAAEEMIARLSADELLGQPYGPAQSKGQVLRSLVRGARKQSPIVERRSE
ncbi:hypothetical protein [Aurantiacibacter suaedae]|uniref:hypothetical protein n=1 Tax=Aurantiacibacter suaedae TaxID=2545755 RepID=UPI0010F5D21B|nr:hypothetical protein [Aurantiacibacter suaedae]